MQIIDLLAFEEIHVKRKIEIYEVLIFNDFHLHFIKKNDRIQAANNLSGNS